MQAKGKPCNLRRLQQARAAPTLLHANLPSRQASPHRGWGYIGANNIAAHAPRLAFCSRRYGAYGMALQPRQVAAPCMHVASPAASPNEQALQLVPPGGRAKTHNIWANYLQFSHVFIVFFDILRLRCQKLPKTYNVLPPCARL